jgi:hypothetical protein
MLRGASLEEQSESWAPYPYLPLSAEGEDRWLGELLAASRTLC